MSGVTSKPEYSYTGIGDSLAIHMSERILVINGRTFPFSDIRSVRTYRKTGFFLNSQGIEIEVNDLHNPLIRVKMNPKPQGIWVSRIGQICGMRSI